MAVSFSQMEKELKEELKRLAENKEISKHKQQKLIDFIQTILTTVDNLKERKEEEKYNFLANNLLAYHSYIQANAKDFKNTSIGKWLENTLGDIVDKVSNPKVKNIITDLGFQKMHAKHPRATHTAINPIIQRQQAEIATQKSLAELDSILQELESPSTDDTKSVKLKEPIATTTDILSKLSSPQAMPAQMAPKTEVKSSQKPYEKNIDKYLEQIAGKNRDEGMTASYSLKEILKGKEGIKATKYLLADKGRIEGLSPGSWAEIAKISPKHAQLVLTNKDVITQMGKGRGTVSDWLRNIGESDWKIASKIINDSSIKKHLNNEDKKLLHSVIEIDSQAEKSLFSRRR